MLDLSTLEMLSRVTALERHSVGVQKIISFGRVNDYGVRAAASPFIPCITLHMISWGRLISSEQSGSGGGSGESSVMVRKLTAFLRAHRLGGLEDTARLEVGPSIMVRC